MKRRKIILFVGLPLLIALAVLWKVRVDHVNAANNYPQITYYDLGKTAALDDNMSADDLVNMNGYSVTVIGSHLYTLDEYLAKCGLNRDQYIDGAGYSYLSPEGVLDCLPPKILAVDITLNNTDNTDTGVDFTWWQLQGTAAIAHVGDYLYELSNPAAEGNTMISLREDSSYDLELPFALFQYNMCRAAQKDPVNYGLYLVISDFPVSERLAIE